MSRSAPAAAFLIALCWAMLGGSCAEAGVVTPEWDVRAASDAAPGPPAPPSEAPGFPSLDHGEGGSTGAPAPVPTVLAGAALPAAPIHVLGGPLPAALPLPDRCLRPLLYPGGIFRPPRCA